MVARDPHHHHPHLLKPSSPPRIALSILNLVGTSPALIMLGFMACSMFLSMWISNTACTAMMVVFLQDCVEPFPFYLKPRHIIVYQVPIVDAISLAISSTNRQNYCQLCLTNSNLLETNHDTMMSSLSTRSRLWMRSLWQSAQPIIIIITIIIIIIIIIITIITRCLSWTRSLWQSALPIATKSSRRSSEPKGENDFPKKRNASFDFLFPGHPATKRKSSAPKVPK